MADETAGTTGKTSPAPGTEGAAGAAGTGPGVDLKTLKFDGDGIPDKFKGKTVAEIAKIYGDLEAEHTKASQINKKWNDWYQAEYSKGQAQPEGDARATGSGRSSDDPREAFEENQISALGKLFEVAMAPVVDALSGIQRESVKSSRPDFDSFEARAKEIYDQMPYAHKINPNYGWNFAYNMARAEKMGKEPPPAPNTMTAGTAPAPGKTEPEALSPVEDLWAKRFKMSPEEYRKYSIPREED